MIVSARLNQNQVTIGQSTSMTGPVPGMILSGRVISIDGAEAIVELDDESSERLGRLIVEMNKLVQIP